MKTLKASLILLVAILLSSCSSLYYKYDESTARYMNPAMIPILITPTIADLDISNEKITATEKYDNTLTQYDFDNFDNSPTIEYLKNYTVSKVVKQYDADVIVAPIFDIQTSEDYGTINVTVTGYPAKFVNLRNVTESDSTAMKVYELNIIQPK